MKKEKPSWLKSKGYLHLTAQLDTDDTFNEITSKIYNAEYISKYAFYPLIHSVIKERRYKKKESNPSERAHSYIDCDGKIKRNIKERPLHYATHMDAIIFGYYAEILQNHYEEKIRSHPDLNDSIIAYRKIPTSQKETNKSTIHFANEVFQEIKKKALQDNNCAVLTFDIKSFFSSLDHKLLKKTWASLLGFDKLPDDHYNVFKAATRFSYILKDDLRKINQQRNRKKGFDEKKIAQIRNNIGIHSFFESPEDFRNQIKKGHLKIHKYPFRNSLGEPIGIPQGLPISAVLANLYLMSFDFQIIDKIVKTLGAFYRRYSDDIVIVCSTDQINTVKAVVEEAIKDSLVTISTNKTEIFLFKVHAFGKKAPRLACFKLLGDKSETYCPLTYLGFEFNGSQTLVKSANLSKFYRRMISSVKSKAKIAKKCVANSTGENPVIFRRQLYKLYTARPLSKTKIFTRWKTFKKNELGQFRLTTGKREKKLRSNYLSYVSRASEIMKEPAILNQIRNHKRIFNEAIYRHLKAKNFPA